jgi:hypothetical protein
MPHLAAVSFEQVMRRARAKFVTGLTATPVRKDGHHPIIYMHCGPIRFNMPVRSQIDSSPFERRWSCPGGLSMLNGSASDCASTAAEF